MSTGIDEVHWLLDTALDPRRDAVRRVPRGRRPRRPGSTATRCTRCSRRSSTTRAPGAARLGGAGRARPVAVVRAGRPPAPAHRRGDLPVDVRAARARCGRSARPPRRSPPGPSGPRCTTSTGWRPTRCPSRPCSTTTTRTWTSTSRWRPPVGNLRRLDHQRAPARRAARGRRHDPAEAVRPGGGQGPRHGPLTPSSRLGRRRVARRHVSGVGSWPGRPWVRFSSLRRASYTCRRPPMSSSRTRFSAASNTR